jgi:hypothetical protein
VFSVHKRFDIYNPYNEPVKWGQLLSLFYRRRHWRHRELKKLIRVTQSLGGRARSWTLANWIWSLYFYPQGFLVYFVIFWQLWDSKGSGVYWLYFSSLTKIAPLSQFSLSSKLNTRLSKGDFGLSSWGLWFVLEQWVGFVGIWTYCAQISGCLVQTGAPYRQNPFSGTSHSSRCQRLLRSGHWCEWKSLCCLSLWCLKYLLSVGSGLLWTCMSTAGVVQYPWTTQWTPQGAGRSQCIEEWLNFQLLQTLTSQAESPAALPYLPFLEGNTSQLQVSCPTQLGLRVGSSCLGPGCSWSPFHSFSAHHALASRVGK